MSLEEPTAMNRPFLIATASARGRASSIVMMLASTITRSRRRSPIASAAESVAEDLQPQRPATSGVASADSSRARRVMVCFDIACKHSYPVSSLVFFVHLASFPARAHHEPPKQGLSGLV